MGGAKGAGGDRGREDGGRSKEELMSFTFWVKQVTKASAVREEGRGWGGEDLHQ